MKRVNLLKNKRGISPLIATVLLIAFAVALGAVVMTWGKSYITNLTTYAEEKSAGEMKCDMQVRINFAYVDNQKELCFGEFPSSWDDTYLDIDSISNIDEIEEIFDEYASSNVDSPTNYTEMVIENGPHLELEGLQITLLGTKEILIYDFNETIKRAGVLRIRLPYDEEGFGRLEQVKVLPKIKVGGAETENYCINSAQTASFFFECDEV